MNKMNERINKQMNKRMNEQVIDGIIRCDVAMCKYVIALKNFGQSKTFLCWNSIREFEISGSFNLFV